MWFVCHVKYYVKMGSMSNLESISRLTIGKHGGEFSEASFSFQILKPSWKAIQTDSHIIRYLTAVREANGFERYMGRGIKAQHRCDTTVLLYIFYNNKCHWRDVVVLMHYIRGYI